jgi:hypothetical protein
MREAICWELHNSTFLRKIYGSPALAPLMTRASNLLLPSSTEKVLKVRSGPGKGLLLKVNARWEPHLWQGDYETSCQEIAVKYFVPGKTLYDVGGGFGFYSILAARLGAQIFTLEPDPRSLAWIEGNARRSCCREMIGFGWARQRRDSSRSLACRGSRVCRIWSFSALCGKHT